MQGLFRNIDIFLQNPIEWSPSYPRASADHQPVVFVADVAQLVRALDCGSKCRGFESRRSPFIYASFQ